MNNIINHSVILSTSIIYNSFFYQIINILYKNIPFEEKKNKSVILLVIGGIIGIVLTNLHFEQIDNDYKPIKLGIRYGSYFLLVSTFINYYELMNNETRLFFTISIFSSIIYYYKKYQLKK
jgi:hypothetical protein